MSPNKARKRLACIRCVLDTIKSIKSNTALPQELCFVPAEVEFVITPDVITTKGTTPLRFKIFSAPKKDVGKSFGRIPVSDLKTFSLVVTGDEYADDSGDWIKLTKVFLVSFF